jgi:hypothetical protein
MTFIYQVGGQESNVATDHLTARYTHAYSVERGSSSTLLTP